MFRGHFRLLVNVQRPTPIPTVLNFTIAPGDDAGAVRAEEAWVTSLLYHCLEFKTEPVPVRDFYSMALFVVATDQGKHARHFGKRNAVEIVIPIRGAVPVVIATTNNIDSTSNNVLVFVRGMFVSAGGFDRRPCCTCGSSPSSSNLLRITA